MSPKAGRFAMLTEIGSAPHFALQTFMPALVALGAVTYRARVVALVEAIRLSLHDARMNDECAALDMEIDQSQWTKQRESGGVGGRLIGIKDVRFWQAFLPRLGSIVGVPVVLAGSLEDDDARLERIVRRVVLKAGLPCERSDSSAA